jgi:rubrerythrin
MPLGQKKSRSVIQLAPSQWKDLEKFEDMLASGIKDELEAIKFYENLIDRAWYLHRESLSAKVVTALEENKKDEERHLLKLRAIQTALHL